MKLMFKRALSVVAMAAVLGGCASETPVVHMAPLPVVTNSFALKTVWSTKVGNGVGEYFSHLSPAMGYGKVFVADRNGLVEALNPATGKVLWSTNLEKDKISAELSGGLSLGFGKIFIGTGRGTLIALDAETGKQVWQATTTGQVLSAPLVDQGMIVVNTGSGVLQAFDAETGVSKWSLSSDMPALTIRGNSAPVGIADGVFWGQANGMLSAALLSSGQLIWQQQVSAPKGTTEMARLVDVNASPIAVGDFLFAVGYNGNLIAVNGRNGQVVWKMPYSSVSNMTFHNNILYLVTSKDDIIAVNAENGQMLWKNDKLQYRRVTAPAWIDGKLVVGDGEGYLHWFDGKTGKLVGQQKINSDGLTVPPMAMSDGFLVTTRNGQVDKMQMPN